MKHVNLIYCALNGDMKQIGFFDESKRLATLSKLGDRLAWLDKVMDWSIFAETLERVRHDRTKRGVGGRPPFSNEVLFKAITLQSLYNISENQMDSRSTTGSAGSGFWGCRWETRCRTRTRYGCSGSC